MNKFSIAVHHIWGKIITTLLFAVMFLCLGSLSVFADHGKNKRSGSRITDAAPPVITYTPLAGTCATGARTLTATITDADGVPTSGTGLPVLYWRINSGPFNAVTGVFSAGNYNFTFGGTAAPGNIVSYYIVAQDNVGNVIAKPSAGAAGYTTNPPAVATDPTNPDFYVIQSTLSAATYTIGAGGAQNYLTITDAVNAYNNSCLSGPVVFVLVDAAYNTSEAFPITISNPAASAANSLTIKPSAGINATISGSSADAIFKLSGADYITIEGSNSGGTTRNLTIINNNTGINSSVIWIASSSSTNGSTNNVIKNCTISGNAPNTTFAGIVSSSGVTIGSAAEAANVNNTYQNNVINTSFYGIAAVGPSTNETGTMILQNTIGSTLAAKKMGYRGILVSNQTNVSVHHNIIAGVNSTFGLGSDLEPSGGLIVSGSITGGSIYSNNIHDIRNGNSSSWQCFGISLQSGNASTGLKVYDNFIYNVTAYGDLDIVAENGHAIAVMTGGGYGIYYNSIHLTNDQTVAANSACVYIGTAVSGTIDLRNNILSNRETTGNRYSVYSTLPNTVFSSINYNDYYSSLLVGFLAVPRPTLAAWQTATGSDGNSAAVNPIFISATDLHLNLISPLNDQGVAISGITVDIDGDTRNPAPDIGADEFTPPPCSNNLGGTVTASNTTVCSSGAITLSSSGFSYGLNIAYQWLASTDNVNFNPIAGETNPTSANPPSISLTTWYKLRVICNGGTAGFSNTVQITVYNPQVLSTTPASRCGPGTVNLAATGTPTTVIEWYATPTGGAPLYTGSPFTTPSLSATTTYYAQSTYPGSSGTVGKTAPTGVSNISNTQYTSWKVYFNVIQATTLLTVDVYPLAAGETSTIDIYNSSEAIIASVPYTTAVSGGNTAQIVPLNISLPVGINYYMYATNGIPSAGLRRDVSGAAYPYNSTDITITGNDFDNSFYMCYYRWRFSNGCNSTPRTPVIATVSASPPITLSITPASICIGSSSTLTASSANAAYIYTWSPGGAIGPSITVSPTVTTAYTVNAVDGACTTNGTITVTVNPAPSAVDIAPATVTKCASAAAQLLTATGGEISGASLINQNFNGTTVPPAGWLVNNVAPIFAGSVWQPKPDGYVYNGNVNTIFHSNDNTQFYIANSDAQPSGYTRTTLQSPAFSLAGLTSATVSFWHNFLSFNGLPLEFGKVEVSLNNTTWTTIHTVNGTQGSSVGFVKVTVSLNAYIGQPTVYIRFNYQGRQDFYWAIDNVAVQGDNTASPITWSPVTGLFTDAAATSLYTGTPRNTVYAKPATTTTYTATATSPNGCSAKDTVVVTVRSVSGVISGNTTVCPAGNAVITVNLTGTGPWNFTYTNGVIPVPVIGVTTSPYTFTVNPLITTTYTLTSVSDAFCTAAAADISGSAVITVSTTAVSTWLGITTDWMSLVNWCGGVPTSTKNVIIPAGTPNYPVIINTLPVAGDITINTGASIIIDATGTLSFNGTFVNNGILTNNGSLILKGTSAQSFPGGSTGNIAAMNTLEINNPAGATINRSLVITGSLKPTAGNITIANDTITLRSTATATASVGALGASAGFTYTGTGKFRVERYISSVTKIGWRFLSAPVNGTQTINQAWQEGQPAGSTVSTGYGTQIVGPSASGPGFDINNTIPSAKKYNPLTNTWVTIPGTANPISTTEGYMLFVRGDRGSSTFGSQSATTLRMAGPIKTGNVTLSTPTANTFISVGNPYPSAVDFAATTRVGLFNGYYLWDPKLGTYGGYQTFTLSGAVYVPSPGGGSYAGGNTFIESGMAFFVRSNAGAAPHSISFSENSKVSGSNQVARPAGLPKNLRTNLSVVSGAEASLYDGVRVDFDAAYSNTTDDNDAVKMNNFGENIGLLRGDKIFAVERRAEIADRDTIFYSLGQLRQQQYELEFTAEGLSSAGLTGYLEDAYLNSSTVISLEGVTKVNFTVNADAGSSGPDRFRLVFRQLGPVPVMFTNVWAVKQGKDILVSWEVDHELNIDHYEVEKSSDGTGYVKIGAKASNGTGSTAQYSLRDLQPKAGDNFYRIRSIGSGNDIKYSKVVKVAIEKEEDNSFVIYPNPVINGKIGLTMNNQPAGEYVVNLYSQNGQLVLSRIINHPGGDTRIIIDTNRVTGKGVYRLEIMLRNGKRGKKHIQNIMMD